MHLDTDPAAPPDVVRWAKVVDHTRCIGCHACTTACRSENDVPLGVTRTYVKYVDIGTFPLTRRAFQVTRCNQCEHAPCVTACPTAAMFRRPDGIVDFDKSICIGCKACIAACPYDAIFINPEDGAAEKCNFCVHRIEQGLEPACVVVCPTEALLVGDLADPASKVARIVHRDAVAVRRPEKDTRPKLFYRGAHEATLDPLAARRPDGGLFLWSEQGRLPGAVPPGHGGRGTSSAAAVLAYDVPHTAPWDWRVSLYTWTKGISAGVYLVAAGLASAGLLAWSDPLWLSVAPLAALLFLAVTGGLLLWDLEHPERFHLIFTRPQGASWLVRGARLITGFGIVLVVHVALAQLDRSGAVRVVGTTLGAALAALTAVYTAFLFAQAKARDLWQSPLGAVHFFVHAVLLGAAMLAVVGALGVPGTSGLADGAAWNALMQVLGIGAFVHLALVAVEQTLTHTTAHARAAAAAMRSGAWALPFRASIVLLAVCALAPSLGVWSALAGLAGVLLYEHAYVQAGQSVPLA